MLFYKIAVGKSHDLTRSCPALQIGIPQDTENGCDVIVVLFFRLPPNFSLVFKFCLDSPVASVIPVISMK